MKEMIISDKALTMSSREIAKLVEKRHDHVLRDIENMLVQLEETSPQIWGELRDAYGRAQKVAFLPKDLTLTLVSGYNVKLRKAIIDKWQELESKQPLDPMQALNDPATMRGLLLNYSEKVLDLEKKVSEMLPQNEAFKRISYADGRMCITDSAKTLQIQPKRVFAYLNENLWIYRRSGGKSWVAYQDRIQTGVLEHKVMTITTSDGEERVQRQVLVTPKGLARLAEHFSHVEAA